MLVESIIADLALYAEQGGFVMPPLMLATVVLWYLVGHRSVNLRRGNTRSVRLMIERARHGKLPRRGGVIDTAVHLGLDEKSRRHDRLRPYLDDRFAALLHQTRQYARLIGAIVAIAPLLGLLGTVVGMIETFNSLGDMSLFSQSGGIAGGISQALFTTQMGLAVAIPGLLAKGFLDRKAHQLEMELAQVKDILCADNESRETPA